MRQQYFVEPWGRQQGETEIAGIPSLAITRQVMHIVGTLLQTALTKEVTQES